MRRFPRKFFLETAGQILHRTRGRNYPGVCCLPDSSPRSGTVIPFVSENHSATGLLPEPGKKAPAHTHKDDHVVYVMKNTGFRLMSANSRSRNHFPETLPSGQPEGR